MDKLKKILKSELGLLLVLALLCIVFAVASPHFLKQQNLLNITRQVSIVLIVSMGTLGVVLTGEIDLSVGSSAALAGVALAYVMSKTGSIWLGIMAALGLGLVMGLLNGCLVVYGKIPSFIVTLATMGIFRGVAMAWTNGKPVSGLPAEFSIWGAGYAFGKVPAATLVSLFILGIFILLLQKTKHGTYIKAIGANSEAAVLSTIPLIKYKLTVFIISGVMSAIGGIITTSKLLSAQPIACEGLEMDVLSGVILGGASLSGGVGTAVGAFIGTLVIGVINNGLNLLNVSSYWQSIVKGIIIVVAVLLKRKEKE